MQKIIIKEGKKYIYDDLTEIIMDICYEVHNYLGTGYKERYYEDCIAVKLKKMNINFERQVTIPLIFEGERIGSRRLDLLLENRLVVELKVGDYLSKSEFIQVMEYLKFQKLKLGLIILFTNQGMKVRRVVNL